MDPKKTRTPGRPRSERSRRAILDATTRLMDAGPIREISIEGVAREASVGKPTIYRWWEDKCSLVMEAFFESMSTSAAVPTRDSTAAALAAHVQRVEKLLRGPAGRIVAEMVGEGQSQPTILTKFRERFFGQLLAPAREALTEGKRSGELDPQLDEEFVLDAVYGPMCYRLRLGHQPLTPRFAQQLGAQLEAMLSFDG